MGKEFFYTDEQGNEQDAELHEPWLNGPGANEATEINRHRNYRQGKSIEEIERFYGPFIKKPRENNGQFR